MPLVALVAMAIMPICLIASSGPAEAAGAAPVASASQVASASPAAPACCAIGNFSVSYNHSWTFVSTRLGVCAVFHVWGNMTYTLSLFAFKGGYYYQWTNQRLNSPTLQVHIYVYSYTYHDCAGSRNLSTVTLGQHWTGYACDFNPSISVGFPWSIGFAAWPSCGDRTQAEYDSGPYPGGYSTYTQYNSGSPSAFGTYTSLDGFRPPCYGVFASGVLYLGSSSDSYGAGNSSGGQSVCLSAH